MSTGSLLTRVDWSVLDEAGRRSLLERPAVRGGTGLPAAVADIIGEVRSQGDAALLRLTAKLDGVTLRELGGLAWATTDLVNARSLIERNRTALQLTADVKV